MIYDSTHFVFEGTKRRYVLDVEDYGKKWLPYRCRAGGHSPHEGNALVIGAMTQRHADVAVGTSKVKAPPSRPWRTWPQALATGRCAHAAHWGLCCQQRPCCLLPQRGAGTGGYRHHQSARCRQTNFCGMYTTALGEGEIITAIRFPIPKRAAYMKFSSLPRAFAGGRVPAQFDAGVRVAVTGASSCVFRHAGLESLALSRNFTPRPQLRWRLTLVT